MKRKVLMFFMIGILSFRGLAQRPADTPQTSPYEAKLKPVFQEWEREDRPGGVVAVVEKAEVVYKK